MMAKILCLTILLSLIFQVQAEVVTDEGNFTLPGVGGRRQTVQQADFTAAEYFAPIKEGKPHPLHWPKQLTVTQDNSLTLELIKDMMLKTQWKMVLHCDGQAILVEKFVGTSWYDGVVNQSSFIKFFYENSHMILNRTLNPPELNPNNIKVSIYESEIASLEDLGDGKIRLKYLPVGSNDYQLMRVQETGEFSLDLDGELDNFYENHKICPGKVAPRRLLVPLNSSALS